MEKLPSVEHVETLSLSAMRKLVAGIVGRIHELEAEVADLRAENKALREDNERLRLDNARLRLETEQLRDEIARLNPRPPFRSSWMEKATEPKSGKAGKKNPRGSNRDKISREEIIKADALAGSRFQGHKSILVRELVLAGEVVRYRRECWVTAEGKTIIPPLPEGISGGFCA